ncbi:MAG: uncharacterized protein PWQ55_2384 [Chloroflexota bacterium]|nr:uncharacterized protein [Chloroflexota bacterium]
MKTTDSPFNKKRNLQISLALLVLLAVLGMWRLRGTLAGSLTTFATVFLGIFIEALPFLLLGTLASGIVEVFVSPGVFDRLRGRSPVLSAVAGSLMGLVFPVCECGVVPLVRRLYKKGLPISTGIAFLLAAPVINPVVIASTASAFGFGRMLALRLGLTFLVAAITGLVFTTIQNPEEVLQPGEALTCAMHEHHHDPEEAGHTGLTIWAKFGRILNIAMDELFEMGRYLIMGSMIAAAMQTFIPQSFLLEVGGGPVLSVLVMIALAILLSICSTVDAFIALSFLGTFTNASVLAFLVYGPMVDIKSIMMFTHVFKRKPVVYLVILPLMLVILLTVSLNYFWVQ